MGKTKIARTTDAGLPALHFGKVQLRQPNANGWEDTEECVQAMNVSTSDINPNKPVILMRIWAVFQVV